MVGKSGELLVDRAKPLFEHFAVRRCGGALQVGGEPRAREFQRAAAIDAFGFLRRNRRPRHFRPRGFFLLRLDLFAFKPPSHLSKFYPQRAQRPASV